MQTTRRAIAEHLRETAATPSELAEAFTIARSTAIDHIEHLARSLRPTEEQVAVRPPHCQDCGFDEFDAILNVPSRCPACNSERIAEPVVRIE